ncbi:MAG: hypothetical protein JXR10_01060 [Cyclobacteriaceae bacterium]
MDDIQFWLYLAFGAIYFITRMFKKKNQPADQEGEVPPTANSPKPVSFEDLLKEFTQEKKQEVEEELVQEVDTTPEEVKWVEENKPKKYEEGRTRRFSDDESKRIYEESIKRAEGAELTFERDEHFKSGIRRNEEQHEDNEIAVDIKEMLSDQDEAKRAIILSEILNRKY